MHIYDDNGGYSQQYKDLLDYDRNRKASLVPRASDSLKAFRPHASYLWTNYSDAFGSDNALQKSSYGMSYQNHTYQNIRHEKARGDVRQAYFDSLVLRGIVNRSVDTIVDSGLRLNLSPDTSVLGISSDRASEVASDVNRRFDLWASSKLPSRDKTLTLYQLTILICRMQQLENDYFIRYHYDYSDKNINPLSISLVNPDDIFGNYDERGIIPKDRSIQDGIQYDKNGVEIAYFVRGFVNGEVKRIRVPAKDKRSGLPIMTHGFTVEQVNQKRGLPQLYAALQECELLQTLTLAQIKSAIKQSSIAMYITNNQQDVTDPTMDIQAMREGLNSYVEEDFSDSFENALEYQGMPEVNLTPGDVALFNLKKGDKLHGFDATSPSEQFSAFSRALISQIAITRSQPYEVVMAEFSDNYSASRGTLILAYRAARIEQNELTSDSLDYIKEAWVYGEIAANRVVMPGFSDPILRSAWLAAEWIGPPMPDIDPLKTIKTGKEALSVGATTMSRIAHEMNGSSYKNNAAQIKQELDELPMLPWVKDKNSATPKVE